MERAYGQFLCLAAFEPGKNARRAVIKEVYEVGEANKAVDFLPINTANPFAIKVFRSHFVWLFARGVFGVRAAGRRF